MEVTIRYLWVWWFTRFYWSLISAHMDIDLILSKALGIRSYLEIQREHQPYTL
jgi:hypothetical protein